MNYADDDEKQFTFATWPDDVPLLKFELYNDGSIFKSVRYAHTGKRVKAVIALAILMLQCEYREKPTTEEDLQAWANQP